VRYLLLLVIAASVAIAPTSVAHASEACVNTGYWPVGDSITEGVASSAGNGWRGMLADRLNSAGTGCGWHYTGSRRTGSLNLPHDGLGGKTINQVASFTPTSFGSMAPNGDAAHVVLWNAGTNDDGLNRTAQQMLDDTGAALDRLHLAGPHVKVLLQQITITAGNNPTQRQAEEDFDNGLPALAASKGDWVRLVDMRGVHLATDNIHPDDLGYGQMADRIHGALAREGWLPGFARDHRIALRAHANNRYVTAEHAGAQPLIANRTAVGQWERLEIVDLGDGSVALWSDISGRYVTADDYGRWPLIANRTAVGPWERFHLLKNPLGYDSLRADINGRFVTAENAGAEPLIANRPTVGDWERFDVVDG
jgi:lysophospholipase L1-like esterase